MNSIYCKIFIYIHKKSLGATSTRPFGEIGGNSPLQLSLRTHLAKIKDKKKLLRKISSKNITAGI